jgi:hypothetical protein
MNLCFQCAYKACLTGKVSKHDLTEDNKKLVKRTFYKFIVSACQSGGCFKPIGTCFCGTGIQRIYDPDEIISKTLPKFTESLCHPCLLINLRQCFKL